MPRPRPLLEIGNPFQSAGPLDPGFEVPGGAVWQPSLTVFGTYRTSLQVFDNGTETFSEWANRLDLYANPAPSIKGAVGRTILAQIGPLPVPDDVGTIGCPPLLPADLWWFGCASIDSCAASQG